MKHLVFLLEEPSAEEMLKGILPQILPNGIIARYVVFEGKQDLDKRVERRVRGWRIPDTAFVVIRDKDSGDCHNIKQALAAKMANAGQPGALVRIACHELESFYLGDLAAVEAGLEIPGLSTHQHKAKYRQPDRIANPAEELIRLTAYQKVSGSRAIAPHLSLDGSNRSNSFQVLVDGIKKIIDDL